MPAISSGSRTLPKRWRSAPAPRRGTADTLVVHVVQPFSPWMQFARAELVLEVERDVLAFFVLVADDVVRAGDDAAGAAGAQAGRDDLLVQLLPLRRPARRSGLGSTMLRNLATERGSPPARYAQQCRRCS